MREEVKELEIRKESLEKPFEYSKALKVLKSKLSGMEDVYTPGNLRNKGDYKNMEF